MWCELEKQQKQQDSALLQQVKQRTADSVRIAAQTDTIPDSVKMAAKMGSFAAFSQGSRDNVTLENDLMKVTLSTQGGSLYSVN